MLAVLNVITGVFVENAIQSAKSQRDYIINKEMEIKEGFAVEMQALFASMDGDGSMDLHLAELASLMDDLRMKTYFEVLGIETHDIEKLFALLDSNQDGTVSMDEFLSGCIRLKGNARSIDMHSVLKDLNHIKRALHLVLTHQGLENQLRVSFAQGL